MRNALVTFCALWLLLGCGMNKGERLQQLEMLEQMNRADSVMDNDSLAEDLVDYFDKHGTPNERLRAHYILGRTYFDLGELPRALETYLEAADCADTTASDCDYKTLSRVHAQSAVVFHHQIQPRSQLKELRLAEYYAEKASDTLMAIECYSQQAEAYDYLHQVDSVIIIREVSSNLFLKQNRKDRYAQLIGGQIESFVKIGNLNKAQKAIDIYESSSGFFIKNGTIKQGREIYYYVKGEYYLATNKIDSAEQMFRKLIKTPSLNNQIAGSKGLQNVYERKGISDSIAKYAKLGYELNDSAYLLSEMQNIQNVKASYNYNHNKLLAEQNKLKAERFKNILLLVVLCGIIVFWFIIWRYKKLKNLTLDYRLKKSSIVCKLQNMANASPPEIPSYDDWKVLRELVESTIPSFSETINIENLSLSDFEYDICLMTRVFIQPLSMSKLKQCSPSYISNIRKRLYIKLTRQQGSGENFDEYIKSIG